MMDVEDDKTVVKKELLSDGEEDQESVNVQDMLDISFKVENDEDDSCNDTVVSESCIKEEFSEQKFKIPDPTPPSWMASDLLTCEHCTARLVGTEMKVHYQQKHLWGALSCHQCEFGACYPKDMFEHIVTFHPGTEGGGAPANCPACEEVVPLGDEAVSLEEHYRLEKTFKKWNNCYFD